jgi:hypothetical protein
MRGCSRGLGPQKDRSHQTKRTANRQVAGRLRAEPRELGGRTVVVRERGETREHSAALDDMVSAIVGDGAASFELVIFTCVDRGAGSWCARRSDRGSVDGDGRRAHAQRGRDPGRQGASGCRGTSGDEALDGKLGMGRIARGSAVTRFGTLASLEECAAERCPRATSRTVGWRAGLPMMPGNVLCRSRRP